MLLILLGRRAAAGLVFRSSIMELTAALLLAPIETHTLVTELQANTASLAHDAAAPYAVVMVMLSALSIGLLARCAGIVASSKSNGFNIVTIPSPPFA